MCSCMFPKNVSMSAANYALNVQARTVDLHVHSICDSVRAQKYVCAYIYAHALNVEARNICESVPARKYVCVYIRTCIEYASKDCGHARSWYV